MAFGAIESSRLNIGHEVEVCSQVGRKGAQIGFEGGHLGVVVDESGLYGVDSAILGGKRNHPNLVVVQVEVLYEIDVAAAGSIPGAQVGCIPAIA